MRTLIAGLAILIGAGVAEAATLKVPQQYETIQAACDAASNGDTILVSKKPDGSPYQEWVWTDKSLKFVGKNVVWDGHRFAGAGGGYGRCLEVSTEGNVNDVSVRGFQFRNGSSHVYIYGHRASIRNCTFKNSYNGSVSIYGDDATVEKCTFSGNSSAVYVNGADGAIRKNRANGHGDGTFWISGDRARLEKNHVTRSGEDTAAGASGDDVVIAGNVIKDGYEGIYVSGNRGLVEKNRLARCEGEDDTGIYAYGTEHLVVDNVMTRIRGYGIYLYGSGGGGEDGDRNVALRNSIRWTDDDGIYVYGTASVAESNRVSYCDGDGIYAGDSGNPDTGNQILENVVSDVFNTGIRAYGGGHWILGNEVHGSNSYGIYTSHSYGGVENVVAGNRVSGFFSWGIYCSAYSSRFHVEDNDVFDGDSWSGGIYVYAPVSDFGVIHANRVSDVGGTGVDLYAYSPTAGLEVTDNIVGSSGTYWDYGVYVYTDGGTVRGNQVAGHEGAGLYINGYNVDVDGNSVLDCTKAGILINGSSCTVTGNTGLNSDGEGFINWGYDTVFTGNTFLGNRLDVTNTGAFLTPNIDASNTFESGGASTSPQFWD